MAFIISKLVSRTEIKYVSNFQKIKQLYTERNKIAHGSSSATDEYWEKIEEAIEYLLVALKRLYLDFPCLIELTGGKKQPTLYVVLSAVNSLNEHTNDSLQKLIEEIKSNLK